MYPLLPKNVLEVIEELNKLPGIGPKTAQRLAFYLLKKPDSHIKTLGEKISQIREGITCCQTCSMLSSNEMCQLCRDPARNPEIVCVVENTMDVIAIEKTRQYQGLYHVLHGVLSPIDGIGPHDLTIENLMKRIKNSSPPTKELILATNPNMEGETTALYLHKLVKPFNLKITRIALGMPVGGELEYADEVTITRALEGRREYL